jgi:hypothetical protein
MCLTATFLFVVHNPKHSVRILFDPQSVFQLNERVWPLQLLLNPAIFRSFPYDGNHALGLSRYYSHSPHILVGTPLQDQAKPADWWKFLLACSCLR